MIQSQIPQEQGVICEKCQKPSKIDSFRTINNDQILNNPESEVPNLYLDANKQIKFPYLICKHCSMAKENQFWRIPQYKHQILDLNNIKDLEDPKTKPFSDKLYKIPNYPYLEEPEQIKVYLKENLGKQENIVQINENQKKFLEDNQNRRDKIAKLLAEITKEQDQVITHEQIKLKFNTDSILRNYNFNYSPYIIYQMFVNKSPYKEIEKAVQEHNINIRGTKAKDDYENFIQGELCTGGLTYSSKQVNDIYDKIENYINDLKRITLNFSENNLFKIDEQDNSLKVRNGIIYTTTDKETQFFTTETYGNQVYAVYCEFMIVDFTFTENQTIQKDFTIDLLISEQEQKMPLIQNQMTLQKDSTYGILILPQKAKIILSKLNYPDNYTEETRQNLVNDNKNQLFERIWTNQMYEKGTQINQDSNQAQIQQYSNWKLGFQVSKIMGMEIKRLNKKTIYPPLNASMYKSQKIQ